MEIVKNTAFSTRVMRLADPAKGIVHLSLHNDGVEISVTNIGASLMSVRTQDKNGVVKNIVAGFSNASDYKVNRDYFGCVVGRYANRIADGRLELQGKVYQLSLNAPPNHLHGGFRGFGHKIWELEEVIESASVCGVVFSYLSADGEEGYPGNLQAKVTYLLHGCGRLEIRFGATTDRATAVNLTNHSYFNLSGFENSVIHDHRLKVAAAKYTEKSAGNTTTGRLLEVKGSALDFTHSRRIGDGIDQFPADMGYDHNFVLDDSCKDLSIPAATLSDPGSGRVLNVYTDKPGIQIYTGNYWNGTIAGEQGFSYQQHGGIALETQSWPDSVHHPHFPNTILQPGEEYRSATIFEFLTVS